MIDRTPQSRLEYFIDNTLDTWATQRKDILDDKLRRNYEAVTNMDYRTRKWKKGEGEKWRSRVWIGFVRVKVWSWLAVMMDIVLRAGKIPFTLEKYEYDQEYMHPLLVEELDRRIERMQKKIEDQHKARNADRELMKIILSGGYYGMAFSAFDIDQVSHVVFKPTLPDGTDANIAYQFLSPEEVSQLIRFKMERVTEDVPGHRYVSVWHMIWDMDAEEFQHNGGYAELEPASRNDLASRKGQDGFIDDQIDLVMRETEDDDNDDGTKKPGYEAIKDRRRKLTIKKFYMPAPTRHVENFEREILRGNAPEVSMYDDDEEAEKSGNEVEIMGEMVSGRIIKLIRNNLGKRPHKMWTVERNLDETTGTGIADNMAPAQDSLVGMLRAFEDNKKLSANVILAVKKRMLENPSQIKTLQPGTQIDINDEATDVRQAILPVLIPDVGETLMSGINLMMQLKDDVSMIPTILQGVTLPKHKPDTAFELDKLDQNANRYIGLSIRNLDEQMIEDHVNDIYEYNMILGDDERCKVNAKVKANGYSSFQNKEVRGARMQQTLAFFITNEVMRPYVKIDPHLRVIYEAMDEDPENFIHTQEEMQQNSQNESSALIQQQQQAIQAELIKLAGEIRLEMQKEFNTMKIDHQNSIEQSELEHQHKLSEEDQEHQHRLIEDGLKTINQASQKEYQRK